MADNNHKDDRKDDRILLWAFQNDKDNERQPDFTGPGRISKNVLKDLIDAFKEFGDGEKLELRCAGWNRKSNKNGNEYFFITIEPNRPRETVSDEDLETPF